MPLLSPLPYALLLAAAVAFGIPSGALVLAAGALFKPGLGVVVVFAGQGLGLLLNWRLCRGVLRPRLTRRLERTQRGRTLGRLLHQPASLRLMLLLRLALIPMNVVNIACALGPTPVRPYVLASLALLPRFALIVFLGSLGADALRGSSSPFTLALRAAALAATAAALLLLARGVRRQLASGRSGLDSVP
jgi:uncharacterized membrane protein YdjX (TVP38/TMEM64 family)